MSDTPEPKRPNTLIEFLFNLILPILILRNGTKWFPALGAEGALVVALLFPIGYFIYDFRLTKSANGFSILGVVSVILTGGIGLLKLGPEVFAFKEALLPLIFGGAIAFTIFIGKPFFKTFIFNKRNRLYLDMLAFEQSFDSDEKRSAFDTLMTKCTWIFASSFLVSAVLNYFITRAVVTTHPNDDAEAFNAEIGNQTWITFVVISVCTMPLMIVAMMKLFGGYKKITGRDFESLLPQKADAGKGSN